VPVAGQHEAAKRLAEVGRGCEASRRSGARLRSVSPKWGEAAKRLAEVGRVLLQSRGLRAARVGQLELPSFWLSGSSVPHRPRVPSHASDLQSFALQAFACMTTPRRHHELLDQRPCVSPCAVCPDMARAFCSHGSGRDTCRPFHVSGAWQQASGHGQWVSRPSTRVQITKPRPFPL
jgi:hypothetical protein